MAHHLPPTAEEDQNDEQAQVYGASPVSRTQNVDSTEDVLRNAPTFPLEEEDTPGKEEEKGASGSAEPKPGFLQKIMVKLGLNPIILMSMFKSVSLQILCLLWQFVDERIEADPS